MPKPRAKRGLTLVKLYLNCENNFSIILQGSKCPFVIMDTKSLTILMSVYV